MSYRNSLRQRPSSPSLAFAARVSGFGTQGLGEALGPLPMSELPTRQAGDGRLGHAGMGAGRTTSNIESIILWSADRHLVKVQSTQLQISRQFSTASPASIDWPRTIASTNRERVSEFSVTRQRASGPLLRSVQDKAKLKFELFLNDRRSGTKVMLGQKFSALDVLESNGKDSMLQYH